MQVLLVEDEVKTAKLVEEAIREQGAEVEWVADGCEGEACLTRRRYDIAVSDLRLPGLDGITLVRRMRSRGDRTPVLLMSACGGVEDRVQGLDAGADDYLPKPFAMPELLARIRALTRRPDDPQPLSLRVGDLTLDIVARKATRDGRKIELTNREFELLWLLMRTPGQVCRRSWILEKVWECRFDPRSNIVEVHMSHLRDKVDGGFATPLILSVRGHGYMISDTPVLQGSPTPISQ